MGVGFGSISWSAIDNDLQSKKRTQQSVCVWYEKISPCLAKYTRFSIIQDWENSEKGYAHHFSFNELQRGIKCP